MKKKAIVLLSGGLDSSTCLAMAKSQGFMIYALTIQYGQRHTVELTSACKVAEAIGVEEHKTLTLDLKAFGGSALTDETLDVPLDRQLDATDIPITYVPARNTIFLSLAMAWAEVLEADHIFIGVGAVDYSGYPDCRPEFIDAFQQMANKATARWADRNHSLTIHTPLLMMPKSEVINTGIKLGLNYKLTHSCYNPSKNGLSCGSCDSCKLRIKAFHDAGISDPTEYI